MAAKKDDSLKIISDKYGETGASQALKGEQLEALAGAADRAAFDTLLSSYTSGEQQPGDTGNTPETAQPTASAPTSAPLADPDAETADERAARLAAREAAKLATSTPAVQAEPPEGWVQVRVGTGTDKNPVAEGASFIHPEGRVLITADRPAYVPDDNWTGENLARKILKRV